MIEQGKDALLKYDTAALNASVARARAKYEEAYNQELSNSQGLDFGIISNSLTSHLIYATQSAIKERDNQKNADAVANKIYQANDPFARSDLMTKMFYDETIEPYYIDVLTKFYSDLQNLIYKGANRENSSITKISAPINFKISTPDENKVQIIKGVTTDTYFSDSILFAIKNNIIDTELINFFAKAPEFLQKNTQNAIVAYLNEQKETARLFNRDSLSDDVISVIKNTKLLYSFKISIYENIVNSLYKAEIKKVSQKFDDLLRVGNNPESLSAYAKNKRAITITSTEIFLFLKYYDIFATEKMKKVIALIGSAETDKFDEYLTALNEKIVAEYEKHQQAERERKAREEQLARERRKREEQHRQEVEEKKCLIREEIQSLNSELESLGFALFGQKARRKAELKELIATKQSELYSIK